LQAQHHVGQFFHGYFSTLPQLADFVILAIDTAQIAARKKDRPGSVPAAKRCFFTMVRAMAGHERLRPHQAETEVSFEAVDRAMTGTHMTPS
jgi:hypothetical protein